ncbi:SDR family NAD(P)-dependent oxidoreductase [Nocardiopsis composta]|uniref:NAD(P)-dependent dehydrogenase (Short-subunit alcohol dehydrogenase family) n=1 Tax=Nocardiopsis composta TaxID=157465 RepID=A0A7W8VCJ2_9ACTN|nr:SDR family NAD(P)-dependent oxidoreductase [Nocardiopsis composta]MBB5430944.1 NAD(P)-dependent dehydrogenase (short-subunit alcohol dehydrogenase family) [Nocardiopsis composta]
MGSLDGRIAVITGAGNGIGREHALLFAREGAAVVVNDPGTAPDGSGSDASVAEAVARTIREAGGRAVASTDSVADPAGARRIVDTAVEAFGDLHAVVNNAGNLRNAPLVDMEDEDFDAVLGVHLKGTFSVTRAAARYWSARTAAGDRRDRSIVNTASGSGTFTPLPTQANYAAAKAGVAALTTVASLELRAYGVRVNAVAPSAHRTRLTRNVPGVSPGTGEGADPYAPDRSSPLTAHLSSAACTITGQLFQVHDRTVAVGRGWSLGERIRGDRPWTPEALGAALAELDLTDPADPLLAALDRLDDPERARALFRRALEDPATLRAMASSLT